MSSEVYMYYCNFQIINNNCTLIYNVIVNSEFQTDVKKVQYCGIYEILVFILKQTSVLAARGAAAIQWSMFTIPDRVKLGQNVQLTVTLRKNKIKLDNKEKRQTTAENCSSSI